MARIDLDINNRHLQALEKPKLTCSDVISLLGDYVDRELPPTLKARVDQHFDQCPSCQEVKAGYQLVIELAHELKPKPVAVAVENRLRAGLNKRLGISLPMIDPAIAASDC